MSLGKRCISAPSTSRPVYGDKRSPGQICSVCLHQSMSSLLIVSMDAVSWYEEDAVWPLHRVLRTVRTSGGTEASAWFELFQQLTWYHGNQTPSAGSECMLIYVVLDTAQQSTGKEKVLPEDCQAVHGWKGVASGRISK